MKCNYCGHIESKVVDSRPNEEGTSIRRRRECIECGKRFTTYERVENFTVMVVKKDGRREAFDSAKLLNGIRKACEKRPVAMKELDDMVVSIEKEVANSLDQEIRSEKLGEIVMRHLKDLDEVAYVRFASVYRQFKDINTFMDELNKLLNEEKVE